MRQVITVWNRARDSHFEKHVPLALNGERNRRLGSSGEFDVLFLEGLELLSSSYRQRLSELGYRLHNVEGLYKSLSCKYTSLARFGDYEQKCFLRWLAIGEHFREATFVHYDADIVFNATPEELEADFEGLTFVLQGCPAYTRVGDPVWLEIYRAELDRYVADIEGYSAEAWRQRPAFAATFHERNGGLWERSIISSDQDLLQYLTLSRQLPQADAVAINDRGSSALFQNPLVIGRDIQLALPLTYERRNGIDYIGGRKVAFWHMQNDFCNYLGYAAFLRSARARGRIPWVRAGRPWSYVVYRALRRGTPLYSRGELMRRYFGEGSVDLGFVLNDRSFWESGVFV
jgi:hypothetical protein